MGKGEALTRIPNIPPQISVSMSWKFQIHSKICANARAPRCWAAGLGGGSSPDVAVSVRVGFWRRRCGAHALKNHLQSIPKALADRGYTPSTTTRAATTLPRYCPSAAVKGTRRGLAGSLHHWSGARRNPIRSYSLHAQATATRLHPGATLATAPARIYYARQWAKIK